MLPRLHRTNETRPWVRFRWDPGPTLASPRVAPPGQHRVTRSQRHSAARLTRSGRRGQGTEEGDAAYLAIDRCNPDMSHTKVSRCRTSKGTIQLPSLWKSLFEISSTLIWAYYVITKEQLICICTNCRIHILTEGKTTRDLTSIVKPCWSKRPNKCIYHAVHVKMWILPRYISYLYKPNQKSQ